MTTTNPTEIPVVILAGGRGARFDHESQVVPKPMIEVAGKPILEHIIDGFIEQGFREFIIAVGYLGEVIKSWSLRKYMLQGSAIIARGFKSNEISLNVNDTGQDSHTGERLWRLRDAIMNRRFVLTYGDGLSDVNMINVIKQHDETGAGVTMTAVRPLGRFGAVEFCSSPPSLVSSFREKPLNGWINGGFMVVEPEFIDRYIEEDNELEGTALPELAADGGLHAFRHDGYWACMDTRRDREQIEEDVSRNGGRLPWLRQK